jgi:hypothetical protein
VELIGDDLCPEQLLLEVEGINWKRWLLTFTLFATHCRLPCLVFSSCPDNRLDGVVSLASFPLLSFASDARHTLFLAVGLDFLRACGCARLAMDRLNFDIPELEIRCLCIILLYLWTIDACVSLYLLWTIQDGVCGLALGAGDFDLRDVLEEAKEEVEWCLLHLYLEPLALPEPSLRRLTWE